MTVPSSLAEAFACHTAECRPPTSGGTGGSSPRTGRGFGGMSADPDNRTKPVKTIGAKELTMDTDAIGKRVFNHKMSGGHYSEINAIDEGYENNSFTFSGAIRNAEGHTVGNFVRTMSIKGGALDVYHDELFMDRSAQNTGLATEFNQKAIEEYRALGVDHVSVSAGDDVGGYAWAREGFRLRDRNDFPELVENSKTILAQAAYLLPEEHVAKGLKQLDALERAHEAGEDVQPIHIASIGEDWPHTRAANRAGEYDTWPGKEMLLGNTWDGVYYFDAANSIQAAASQYFAFDPHQPRDKNGMWTVGFQHVASKANAESIMREGFRKDAPAWSRYFGNGVYVAEHGDQKSAKFYARQGGRTWRDAQVVEGTVSLKNPAHIEGDSQYELRSQMAALLGGKDNIVKAAQAEYDRQADIVRKAAEAELKPDNPGEFAKLDMTHPESAVYWNFSEEAGKRFSDRLEAGGIDYGFGSMTEHRNLAERYDEAFTKPQRGATDQWGVTSDVAEILGNMLHAKGYDGLVINTKKWQGVGGGQIVVFDPSAILSLIHI